MQLIQMDKLTKKYIRPTLLLRTRSGKFLGKINYSNFKCSFVANGIDEISFQVNKYVDGKKSEIWDKLRGLTIIEYVGYGRFEANFPISDEETIVKTCTAQSLEVELGQRYLRDFHVNDEDARTADDFSPTVLCDFNDEKHSLLHRVIADQAPHWKLRYVSDYFNINGTVYKANEIQRMFTEDGTSVYDFLTQTVASEMNCVFLFDTSTSERYIDCLNIEECVFKIATKEVIEGAYCINGLFYDDNGNLLEPQAEYNRCVGVGKDTNVFMSKRKIAQSFQVDFDVDSVKNCFYVTGGDDNINSSLRVANLTGNQYIYLFDKFQYDDMSDELSSKLQDYSDFLVEKDKEFNLVGGVYVLDTTCTYDEATNTFRDAYGNVIVNAKYFSGNVYVLNPLWYSDNGSVYDDNGNYVEPYVDENNTLAYLSSVDIGIYIDYCQNLQRLSYWEHTRFPNVDTHETSCENELSNIKDYFRDNAVLVENEFSNDAFVNVTNTIKNLFKLVCDTRYEVVMVDEPLMNIVDEANCIGFWSCDIYISKIGDENDISDTYTLTASCKLAKNSDELLEFAKQKIDFAIAELNISELDFEDLTEDELYDYLWKYNYTSVESYYKNFDSCVLTINDLFNNLASKQDLDVETSTLISDAGKQTKDMYVMRKNVAKSVMDEMKKLVDKFTTNVDDLFNKITKFREEVNLKNYLNDDSLWIEFQSYIREDEYNNSNYISDGLDDYEMIDKAKELLDVAKKELKKACKLQRTVSGDINNLFSFEELEILYESFSLYNYVRSRIDDDIYKLRLIQFDFDENSPDKIEVTFSDMVDVLGSKPNDLESIKNQVQSIGTSYSSTALQAKQGATAQSTFNTIRDTGLNSSLYVVKNSNKELVTIDERGLNCKSESDLGFYGDCQVRLIGNGLYMTQDGWDSISCAIGKMLFNDRWVYGVNAELVCGEFIVGENLTISNKDTTVVIDDNGLKMENGYLHLTNGEYSIEVDPNHQGDGTLNGYLCCINKNNADGTKDIIMSVDTEGNAVYNGDVYARNGVFNGEIHATSGSFYTTGDGGFTDISYGYVNVGKNSTIYGRLDYGEMDLTSGEKAKGVAIVNRIDGGGYAGIGHTDYTTNENGEISVSTSLDYYILAQGDNVMHHFQKGYVVIGDKYDDLDYNNTYGLSVDSSAYIHGSLKASSIETTDIAISGSINGSPSINGGLSVRDNQVIYGGLTVGNNQTINGSLTVLGDVSIGGNGVVKKFNDGGHTLQMGWDGYNIKLIVDSTYFTLVSKDKWTTYMNLDMGGYKLEDGTEVVYPNLASVDWVQTKVDSDERVKTNFKELPSCIDSIFDSLHPQQYEFNDILEKDGIYFGDTAQHIEKVFEDNGLDIENYSIIRKRDVSTYNGEDAFIKPDDVDNKYHYINQDNIIWLCVDQIQKLKNRIMELEEQL